MRWLTGAPKSRATTITKTPKPRWRGGLAGGGGLGLGGGGGGRGSRGTSSTKAKRYGSDCDPILFLTSKTATFGAGRSPIHGRCLSISSHFREPSNSGIK